jgi:catechol 2,3-dioxygenase-like lactoylglutathione lyase family enzyme
MLGAEHIDHVAIPVRDLPKAEVFYLDWLSLKLKTRRKNLDGSPRQTYVLAGENIIGLHLPGVTAEASTSTAPRVGIAVSAERFAAILKRLDQEGHAYRVAEREQIPLPVLQSASFLDSDGNWVEIGVWRDPSSPEYLSQIVVETVDVEKTQNFYVNVLGMKPLGRFGAEHFLKLQSGQLYGLRPVASLSERSRRHGRGCHIALNVSHDEFDEMLQMIPEYGGQNQGDPRADDGLRPEGEKSTYFFDPDKNRLQITAAAESEMLSDEKKWQRIVDNRAKQGRALSRWDRGESTKSQK